MAGRFGNGSGFLRRRQVAAVGMAILVVVAGILAYVTFLGGTVTVTVAAQSFDGDSLSHRRQALSVLRSSSGEEDLVAALNETTTAYVDRNRTRQRSVFETDARVLRSVDGLGNARKALLTSDAILAWTAIEDARRARAALERRGVSYDSGRVDGLVSDAKRAYKRAEELRESDPTTAVTEYRTAWTKAQEALDRMDAAFAPQVSIQADTDPIHRIPTNHTVRVAVFDIRTYDDEQATITVENRRRTVTAHGTARPVSTTHFEASIPLPERRNEVTIAVRESGGGVVADATAGDGLVGRDTLAFDGDLLVGTFEREQTGTEPLNPDSDGDGTLDGQVDYDGDGLIAYAEQRAGTSPQAVDTDDDGLDDPVEVAIPELNASRADTDGDGTPDAKSDVDGDGLTASSELDTGTEIGIPDTDGDNLDDGPEVNTHGTNATVPDTDGDGLTDGREVRLGTDPTVVDTDDDGTQDSNEKHDLTVTNDEVDATVTVSGTGGVVEDLSIRTPRSPALVSEPIEAASASEMVRIEATGDFEEATVKLGYEASAVVNESDLAVFTYDRGRGRYVPLDSAVFPENDTVLARTEHFSPFVAMERQQLSEELKERRPPTKTTVTIEEDFEDGETEFFTRGRINESGFGDESRSWRKDYGEMRTAGIVNMSNFTLEARFKHPDSEFWLGVLDPYNEKVHIGPREKPWRLLADNFTENSRFETSKQIDTGMGSGGESDDRWHEMKLQVKPIDGVDTIRAKVWPADQPEPDDWQYVRKARTNGHEWLTHEKGKFWVSLTGGQDTGGLFIDYYNLTTYTKYADTDGDGLRDGEEKNGMITGTGEVVTSDPTNNDTDGDGLEDGWEMGKYVDKRDTVYPPHYRYRSHPRKANSDAYGVSDPIEHQLGSDPLRRDNFTVFFRVPTRSRSASVPKPKTGIDGQNYLIEPAEVYTQGYTNLKKKSKPPGWVQVARKAHDGEYSKIIKNNKVSFMLVRVPVVSNGDDLHSVKFEFPDGTGAGEAQIIAQGQGLGDGAIWVSHDQPLPVRGDTEAVWLVLWMPKTPRKVLGNMDKDSLFASMQSGNAKVPGRNGNVARTQDTTDQVTSASQTTTLQRDIGRLRMTAYVEKDSPFVRPRDGTFKGFRKLTVTTGHAYSVQYFGVADIARIYDQSMERIEDMSISAVTVALGPSGKAIQAYGAAKGVSAGAQTLALSIDFLRAQTDYSVPKGLEKLEKGSVKRTKNVQKKDSKRDPSAVSGATARTVVYGYADEIHPHGRTVRVCFTGAVIVRKN